MNDGIIISLISLLGSGCGALVGIVVQSKLIKYRIDQLERKVSEHNNLILRTYENEKQLQINREKLTAVSHRIANIEERIKNDRT
ncbi:MAG: hypothetical protein II501_03670 [Clostridia bacterium]|jgi:hypothetical protein|nr:hypothetical protein [Clostridia bacterium]